MPGEHSEQIPNMANLRLLMISFHFPPVAASSGFLRALKFAKYLPNCGVDPTVLTVKPRAYETTNAANNTLLADLREGKIVRCPAFDAARHFSIRGRYPQLLALPDRWSSWIPFGVWRGLRQVKHHRVDALWVTFPIASALYIGYILAKVTRLPLFVDLRDPIWEEETWNDSLRQRLLRRFEAKVLNAAARVIFTSPGTIEKYRRRYPDLVATKATLITNGYDEEDFANLPVAEPGNPENASERKKLFLHSGLIPAYERNPENFFQAVAQLKTTGLISANNVEFRLRACGFVEQYARRAEELDIADLISFPAPLDYRASLAEMCEADVLMVFQDHTCNWQIPAKVFEYLRAGKPIAAWTDRSSDTANLLAKYGYGDHIAPLANAPAIAEIIEELLAGPLSGDNKIRLKELERCYLSGQLAQLINGVVL